MKIQLDDFLFVGAGKTRKVYSHPSDFKKCIKIEAHNVLNPVTLKRRKKAAIRERRYLSRYARKQCDFTQLARFWGDVDTNLGPGEIYDLVRDDDGNVAQSLGHYLREGMAFEEVKSLLDDLQAYMITNGIIPTDLHVGNVVVQKLDSGNKLVIVDGIGNPEFLKLADYVKALSTSKIKRRIKRLRNKILRRYF